MHLQFRRIFRWAVSLVIQPRCADDRVFQPFLYLGDVGLVLQGIRGRRCPKRILARLPWTGKHSMPRRS